MGLQQGHRRTERRCWLGPAQRSRCPKRTACSAATQLAACCTGRVHAAKIQDKTMPSGVIQDRPMVNPRLFFFGFSQHRGGRVGGVHAAEWYSCVQECFVFDLLKHWCDELDTQQDTWMSVYMQLQQQL